MVVEVGSQLGKLCWLPGVCQFSTGHPRFYPGRWNAVRPVPPVSGSVPATRGCRSLEGVGLLGGNEPLEELGALAETPASGLA